MVRAEAGFFLPAGRPGVFSAAMAGRHSIDIRIESLIEGARRARGTVVIVDVLRAFTTAAVAFARGASRIIIVPEPAEALRLRDRGIGSVCVGEVNGIRPEGFDFGNSPSELMQAELKDKVMILSTRAGTVGVAATQGADEIYAGSFVVAGATAKTILRDSPSEVTLVAMGWNATVRTDEDEQCALYLRNLLQGRRPDPAAVRQLVLASGEIAKFHDPAQPHFHPEDLEIAMEIDKYNFAVRIFKEGEFLVARRQG
jgi:2-phosphosulfolactate phosphatase